MECACGGSTGALQEARNKRLDAVLTYQACLACGRVSGDRLRIGTTLVLTGPRARCEFNTLDQERAVELKSQAERPPMLQRSCHLNGLRGEQRALPRRT